MWFKSDLRTHDNPALSAALRAGDTVAVYLLAPGQWDEHGISLAKRSLIISQLRLLAQQLERLNVPLLVINCERFSNGPDSLYRRIAALDIGAIYFNHEYEVNEQNLEWQVQQKLIERGLACYRFHDACMMAPGQIRTRQGEPYKVFSAFKRAFLADYHHSARKLFPQPVPQPVLPISADTSALDDLTVDPRWSALWPAGEDEAHHRLERFMESAVRHYHQQRDIPSLNGTSQLSPYLAVGALSTTQCMQAAMSLNDGFIDGGAEGVSSWINELIWREFYRHLLVAYPELCKAKPFKANTDRLPWKHDDALFQYWVEGMTGYPIVDAAMRQLADIGWMHNRLRMITAMFLTKHLFVDWRWGERYFMANLIDGDFASNNGGWQWSASTGVDAVPYFRIFNPARQSHRFDPHGEFIRQYVPELRGLDDKSIHQPTEHQAIRSGYPLPVVDHKEAVAQTKYWFKQLTTSI